MSDPGSQPATLVTIVSYCSRESEYASAIVRNARAFSDLVVVCVGTRLYTGEPEDVQAEIARFVKEDDGAENGGAEDGDGGRVIAAVYDVSEHLLGTPIALHNAARQAGVAAARRALSFSQPFWALLIDGDEVPDGGRVRSWWQAPHGGGGVRADRTVVHKMANYWMFLHPQLLAEQLEDSVLLVHSDLLVHRDAMEHPRERDGIYMWHQSSPIGLGNVRVERMVLGEDGAPMFWHFSWVRGPIRGPDVVEGGRAAVKAKCANWGHRADRDWDALIDEAFDGIEVGKWPERDFVHGYPLRLLDRLPSVVL